MKSVTLCPGCGACPAVEIDDNEVRIGEAENLVKLNITEWNELVQFAREFSRRKFETA